MPFCVKCGSRVAEAAKFCTKCGTARNNPDQSPGISLDLAGTIDRDAKIRLKKAHDKQVIGLGLGSGIVTLVGCSFLLAVADHMGRVVGGAFVGALGLLSAAGFLASLRADTAEKINQSLASEKRLDALTGKPLRMVWWFRWLTATVAVFMLVGLSDYVSPPEVKTTEAAAESTPAEPSPEAAAKNETAAPSGADIIAAAAPNSPQEEHAGIRAFCAVMRDVPAEDVADQGKMMVAVMRADEMVEKELGIPLERANIVVTRVSRAFGKQLYGPEECREALKR